MTLFLIGVIGIIAVCVIGLFAPCYYTQGWGYASFHGAKAYKEGTIQTYSLVDNHLNSWALYLLLSTIIIGLIIYTILMLCKKSNLVSNLIIFILTIAPFSIMLLNVRQLKKDGMFLKVNNALVVGAGVNSGFTSTGRLLFILSIIFFTVLTIGFSLNHNKLLRETTNKPPKEIQVKKTTEIPIPKEDFKI